MALLNDKRTSPIGGWSYVQRETGLRLEGDSLEDLAKKVIEHRQYKGLPFGSLAQVIWEVEEQICRGVPIGSCSGEGEVFEDRARSLSMEKAFGFSGAVLEFLRSGGELVSAEESSRRASICRGCQFNKKLGACACTPFWKMVNALVPANRAEEGVHVCSCCGCSLKAKVLMPEPVVEASKGGARFPAWCWQNF